MHHIIFDGVSRDVLLEELGEIYSARVRGEDPMLPILEARYADAVKVEQDLLRGPNRPALVDFWRKQLAGVPELVLPPSSRGNTERERLGGARSWETRICKRSLPASVVAKVREFARSQHTSQFTVYLAVVNVLLHRLTGLSDVAVGTPVAARNQSAFERLIGYLVNVVVIRTVFREMSFGALVRNIRESVFDAMDHQRLPFEAVVEEVHPPRISGFGPLFQVLFALVDPIRVPRNGFAGLDIGPIEQLHSGRSPFALTVSVLDREQDCADLELIYAITLYDDTAAGQIADEFIELLCTALSDPEAVMISELSELVSVPTASAAPEIPTEPTTLPLPDSDDVMISIVQAVWAIHLRTEVNDPDEDFLALGGHSLAAARIAVELRELFGLAHDSGITEVTMFRAPTPRLVAANLAAALGGGQFAMAEARFVLGLLEMTEEQADIEFLGLKPEDSPPGKEPL